jgi:hypothetical protein
MARVNQSLRRGILEAPEGPVLAARVYTAWLVDTAGCSCKSRRTASLAHSEPPMSRNIERPEED